MFVNKQYDMKVDVNLRCVYYFNLNLLHRRVHLSLLARYP